MRTKKIIAALIAGLILTVPLAACDALDQNVGDDISLKDLYTWSDDLDVDDIVKVRYERGGIGVGPDSLVDISYSTDSSDIQNTYAILSAPLTKIDGHDPAPGGSYFKYDFYTENNITYSIRINNHIVKIDNQYYSVNSDMYQFRHSDLDCQSFVSNVYEIETLLPDNVYDGETVDFGQIEFCEYSGTLACDPDYFLTGNGVNLSVYFSDLFKITGEKTVYQVVGENNFSELFEDDIDGEVSLKNLHTWIDDLDVEDILKVRYEQGAVAVGPGSLIDISYSTDRVDIQNTYAILLSSLSPYDEHRLGTGGSCFKYDFFTKNNERFSISISNNLVVIDNQLYRVNSGMYRFQYSDLDCHAFDPYPNSFEVYEYGNETVPSEVVIDLGVLEFCVYDGTVESEPQYLLMGAGIRLLVLSKNLFMIEDGSKVYQVTSEKDFSELFDDEVSLSALYPWIDELALEDIVKVRCEKGGIAVAPGSPVDVAFSTNRVDIAKTYALLSCKLTKIGHGEGIDGGHYVKYVFYTNDATYSITIDNDLVLIDGQYYTVDSFYYDFQYPDSVDSDLEIAIAKDVAIAEIESATIDAFETISDSAITNELRTYLEHEISQVVRDAIALIENAKTIDEIEYARRLALSAIEYLVSDLDLYNASLSDLYPWIDELDVEDIIQVRYESSGVAVAPGSLISIAYTSNSTDIAGVYSLLSISLKSLGAHGSLAGGSYVKYTFYTKNNETYSIKISNNIVYIDGVDYLLEKEFYYAFKHGDLSCYSFVTYSNSYKVQSNVVGNAHNGETINLHYFEFCAYNGRFDGELSYFLKGDGVTLWVLSENLFMIQDDYTGRNTIYQVIGEKDFSEYFTVFNRPLVPDDPVLDDDTTTSSLDLYPWIDELDSAESV